LAALFVAVHFILNRGVKVTECKVEAPAKNAAERIEQLIESIVDKYIGLKFSSLSTKEKNNIIQQIMNERKPKNTVGLRNVASLIRGKPLVSLKVTAGKIWAKAVAEGLVRIN
jgi:hypothetical protein